MQTITFVGLGVHKASTAVSVAAAGRDGEVRHLERLETGPSSRCHPRGDARSGPGVRHRRPCADQGPSATAGFPAASSAGSWGSAPSTPHPPTGPPTTSVIALGGATGGRGLGDALLPRAL